MLGTDTFNLFFNIMQYGIPNAITVLSLKAALDKLSDCILILKFALKLQYII